MVGKAGTGSKVEKAEGGAERAPRADARRNLDLLLRAAMEVFAVSGVDAPMREIAERAGVGVGTVYRHFPQRSDLIVAVLRGQIAACAGAADELAASYEPGEALSRWMKRYVEFLATKRGFAGALHSGDPAYLGLREYSGERMVPALSGLLTRAAEAGVIRGGVSAEDLFNAVANLCHGVGGKMPGYARGMVGVLVDGLRWGAI